MSEVNTSPVPYTFHGRSGKPPLLESQHLLVLDSTIGYKKNKKHVETKLGAEFEFYIKITWGGDSHYEYFDLGELIAHVHRKRYLTEGEVSK